MTCPPLLLPLLVAALVAGGPVSAARFDNEIVPDRYCLSCLCVASSNCDLDTTCREVGGRTFCGPFYMTEHFWRVSNISAEPRFSQLDYLSCAHDTSCAGEAVTRYMGIHGSDCDEDGRITCKDFGLTHLLGPVRCHDAQRRRFAESTLFVRRFARCLVDVLGLLGAGNRIRPQCERRLLSWRAAAAIHSHQQQQLL